MNGLYKVAVEVQQFCDQHHWDFCIIGGLAIVRWGEPRQTQDVDLTILTHYVDEEKYIDALLEHFSAREKNARQFALDNRVLLLEASNGVPIDISLGGLLFEENMILRASHYEYLPGVSLRTASAEDVVVMKAFAGRPRDWSDIESVLVRQATKLDWKIIIAELTPLCELKESPETVDQLIQIRDQLAAENL